MITNSELFSVPVGNNSDVSIILPTLNRADILSECIDSVLAQSYQNFELIICDDGSTDSTESVVHSYEGKTSKIKFIKNPCKKGLPRNRNIGIQNSKGKFIFFIEDDMILDRDCLKFLIESFHAISQKNVNLGGLAPALIKKVNGELVRKVDILNFYPGLKDIYANQPCSIDSLTGIHHYNFNSGFTDLQEVPDMHACSMYSRDSILIVGGYDAETYQGNFLYEETDLNQRLKKEGYKFYFEPQAILHHNVTTSGGCRVKRISYRYFFVLNHTKFVIKNFGSRALLMIPAFFILIAFVGIKAALIRISDSVRGKSS